MTEIDTNMLQLLLGKVEKLDSGVELLKEKVESRMTQLSDKLDAKMMQLNEKFDLSASEMRSEIGSLKLLQNRMETTCQQREKTGQQLTNRIQDLEAKVSSIQSAPIFRPEFMTAQDKSKEQLEKLQKEVDKIKTSYERSDWKVFMGLLLKIAGFIFAVGSAILVLYQIYASMKGKVP